MSLTDSSSRLFLLSLGLLAVWLPGSATAAPWDLRQSAAELDRGAARLRAELAQVQPADRARLASFETRLLRLEEELRALTGRIEELEYRQRQFEEQLKALQPSPPVAQTPATAPIAEAVPSAAPTAWPAMSPATLRQATGTAAAAPPAAATAAPSAAAATRPPAIEADEAARRGYVLGTIPADVLRGVPGAETPAAAGRTATAGAVDLDPRLEAALRGTADQRYQAALNLLEAGEFSLAEEALSRFLEAFPDDPRAPTAAFWLGETYFFRQDFSTAAAVYARNYRKYGPDAPRAAETLLKLGMSLAALGDRERACHTFAELERRHPEASAPVRQMLVRERAAAGCG